MQTISQVESQIKLNSELLNETKKRLQTTATKLSTAKEGVKRIEAEITDIKEKRQAALARGVDAKAMNDSLSKLTSEQELESETVEGLQKFMVELQEEERSLHQKLNELPKRVSQLQAVEIAGRYNALASGIAPIVRELNEVLFKLDSSGCGGKHGRVIFLPDGIEFIEKVIRLTFDNEAINLEKYIQKNITDLPYTPGDTEKYFYVWGTHRQDLISGK